MRFATASAWLSSSLAALCATGCYGPINSPYGYPGQPGYSTYGAPGTFQTLTPGGTYVPGAGGPYVPGAGGTYVPGGSSIPGSGMPPVPTYDPSGGNAQPWGGGTTVPVPTPQDPSGPYYNNNDNFQPPRSSTSLPNGRTAPLAAAGMMNGNAAPAGPAVRPVSFGSSPTPTPAETPAETGDITAKEGVVRFDSASSQWSIEPAGASVDATAAETPLTLAASPLLQTLRAGETVRLEGRMVPSDVDASGRPKFLAARIIRNQP